jgi:membrane protease YdiL (CAAX protease family)
VYRVLSVISARRPGMPIYFFFVGVYAMTWLLQLVVLLARYHMIFLPPLLVLMLFGIADFGPTDVALVLTIYVSGITGAYALLAQAGRWRVKLGWYAVAFFLPIVFVLIPIGINTALGGRHTAYWLRWPQNVGSLIVPPVGEEFGWRGFALPRLQRRYNALWASLILGVIWACWHIPIFFLPGAQLCAFPLFLVGVIAVSILLTWLYNSTGSSLLIVMVAHAGLDLGLITVASIIVNGWLLPIIIMLIYCAAAVVVVLMTGPNTLCRKEAVCQELCKNTGSG